MKIFILFLFISINFISCASLGSFGENDPPELKYNNLIDLNVAKIIPAKTKSIIVSSDLPPDSLYSLLYYTLVKDGFGIKSYNEKMKNITTEIKYVGIDTYLSMNVFVENDGLSKATVSGMWKYGTTTQIYSQSFFGSSAPPSLTNIIWDSKHWDGKYKPNQAFAYMYKICKSVPNTKLIFK